jgi:hypothetical protein
MECLLYGPRIISEKGKVGQTIWDKNGVLFKTSWEGHWEQ